MQSSILAIRVLAQFIYKTGTSSWDEKNLLLEEGRSRVARQCHPLRLLPHTPLHLTVVPVFFTLQYFMNLREGSAEYVLISRDDTSCTFLSDN
jgi:hypothetical protein